MSRKKVVIVDQTDARRMLESLCDYMADGRRLGRFFAGRTVVIDGKQVSFSLERKYERLVRHMKWRHAREASTVSYALAFGSRTTSILEVTFIEWTPSAKLASAEIWYGEYEPLPQGRASSYLWTHGPGAEGCTHPGDAAILDRYLDGFPPSILRR